VTTALLLRPAMPGAGLPDPVVGTWVGSLDERLADGRDVGLLDADGYCLARLLVLSSSTPRGFVEVPVREGVMSGPALAAAVQALPPAVPQVAGIDPAISVVLCTRDRPDLLREALTSLLAMEYPSFEVVVVDNAPSTEATADVVRAFADPRVRRVLEPLPGLSRARNAGVRAAAYDVVAFTDDDVMVDASWLHGLAAGFRRAPEVACVCGIVPSGEIRSVSQAYFDRRVTWARSCRPVVYALSDPPAGDRLFPFRVGEYGTGANFAVRKPLAIALGGFDEALGAGSPAGGGEDIDWFVRTLLADFRLVYEPSAIVWHRHRADVDALEEQARGYGKGLGAWLAKVLLQPRVARMFLRRAVWALVQARRITAMEPVDFGAAGGAPRRSLAVTEMLAVLSGPGAYARGRRSGRVSAPLTTGSAEEEQ
jgi:GT2 family glycosyltransferase